jgi:putative flippase GtrA
MCRKASYYGLLVVVTTLVALSGAVQANTVQIAGPSGCSGGQPSCSTSTNFLLVGDNSNPSATGTLSLNLPVNITLPANVVSLILWTIISYFAHREFTFRFAGEYAGSAARFIFVSLLRLGASIAVVAVVTRYYQSSYLIGVLINWVILPLVSYIALKLWAFRWGPVESAPVRVVGYSPFDGN